jgi:antitoxin component YwqK of YwqJK toxin-antitoxin module
MGNNMNKALNIFVLAFVMLNITNLTVASKKEQINQENTINKYQEGQIIAYFDETFKLVKPEQARYYRQYLGKTAQGWPIIQDFYQGSNHKFCSPATVKPGVNLQSQDAMPWEGVAFCWFENGQKMLEGSIKEGKTNGYLISWHKNGQKSLQGNNKNNELDGHFILWNENGQKTGEHNFKNGKLDGKQVSFICADIAEKKNVPCIKESEIYYKNGKEEGQQTFWYRNGQKRSTSYMKNGKREGMKKKWYENGQKRAELYYKNDNLDGLGNFWDRNGKLEKEVLWQNGKVIRTIYYHSDGSVKTIE